MTVTDAQGLAGTWEGTNVDVGAIRSALARLWQQAGQDAVAGGRQPPHRTSVMNLIIYVQREDEATRVTETVAALSERHPSRTIIVVADPDAPASSLDAAVTSQCTAASQTHGRLCWEQVMIKAHGAMAAHAPGIITPLLLPELPTFLWWADDLPPATGVPGGTDLLRRMVDRSDRLIVDTALFDRPIERLVRLAALRREAAGDHGVSDFHWVRLTPWRNLTAQLFDPAMARPYVQRIDGVRIGYAHEVNPGKRGRGGVAQALLLAGWLAARLGWSARPRAARLRNETLHLEAVGSGGAVSIEVEPRQPVGAEPGEIVTLALSAAVPNAPALFTIERLAEDSRATVARRIGGDASADHTVRMATRSAGELLAEELDVCRHDRVYEDALDRVAELCASVAAEDKS